MTSADECVMLLTLNVGPIGQGGTMALFFLQNLFSWMPDTERPGSVPTRKHIQEILFWWENGKEYHKENQGNGYTEW